MIFSPPAQVFGMQMSLRRSLWKGDAGWRPDSPEAVCCGCQRCCNARKFAAGSAGKQRALQPPSSKKSCNSAAKQCSSTGSVPTSAWDELLILNAHVAEVVIRHAGLLLLGRPPERPPRPFTMQQPPVRDSEAGRNQDRRAFGGLADSVLQRERGQDIVKHCSVCSNCAKGSTRRSRRAGPLR